MPLVAANQSSAQIRFISATVAIGRGSTGRAVVDRRPSTSPDVLADPECERPEGRNRDGTDRPRRPLCARASSRRLHSARTEVRPFTEKQIDLATTFADQAVIAIENVRLFEEVQARTERAAAVAGTSDRDQRRAQSQSAARPHISSRCSIHRRDGGAPLRADVPSILRDGAYHARARRTNAAESMIFALGSAAARAGITLGRAVLEKLRYISPTCSTDPELRSAEAAVGSATPHRPRRTAAARRTTSASS